MDKKILARWIVISLMAAIIFGSLGYMYGSQATTDNCNAYWEAKMKEKCVITKMPNNYGEYNTLLPITQESIQNG